MRYTNQICEGCGKIFTEDDDIVVCPECATPQHRECYKENSGCVNKHKHSDSFHWEGTEIPGSTNIPAPVNNENNKTVTCPNCGHQNPSGSDRCEKCSMKFTLFGFNVVEAAEEEEREKASSNLPEYKAPFSIGEGEGFEENDSPEEPSYQVNRDEVEQQLVDAVSSASGFSPDGKDFSFGGPFPKNDTTSGVLTNLLGAFIGTGAMRYIEKFKKMDMGKKLSFNWAAFFFSPYWFFYRKLLKPGIIFMTITLCLGIVATPYALEFVEGSAALAEQLAEATTEAQMNEIILEIQALYTPMFIFAALQTIIKAICGFIANPLYKKYCVSNITEIMHFPDQKHSLAFLLRKGGAAPFYALLALLGENFLSMIAGMFM